MRTRSLLVVSTALLLVVALIASLGLWVRLFTPVLSFDIAADRTRALPAGYAERSPYPFGEFARYEITVHYVLVRMYNPVFGGHSRHLLLNRPPGEGVRVDLARERLSDVAEEPLRIRYAAGTALEGVTVGIDSRVIVSGYVHNAEEGGLTIRSSSDGFLADGGRPEAIALTQREIPPDVLTGESLGRAPRPARHDLWSAVDFQVQTDRNRRVFHDHLRVGSRGAIECRVPLEIGVRRGSGQSIEDWQIDLSAAVLVPNATVYRKYYVRRAGTLAYTDVLRVVTDNAGNWIPGGITATPLREHDLQSVFRRSIKLGMDHRVEPTRQAYDARYTQHSDGTVDFYAIPTDTRGRRIVAHNVDLLDSPGETGIATFEVGYPASYVMAEYIRAE